MVQKNKPLLPNSFPMQVIKDVQLFGLVGVLLVIVIIILVLWEILDPLRVTRQREDEKVSILMLL